MAVAESRGGNVGDFIVAMFEQPVVLVAMDISLGDSGDRA